MSNYADEANTEDEETAAEDEFAPAGLTPPAEDDDEVNPETGPEGDVTEEGIERPIAPSGS